MFFQPDWKEHILWTTGSGFKTTLLHQGHQTTLSPSTTHPPMLRPTSKTKYEHASKYALPHLPE
ncbi:hypothetical protein NPIL_438981, partial [Nephila pilipes]